MILCHTSKYQGIWVSRSSNNLHGMMKQSSSTNVDIRFPKQKQVEVSHAHAHAHLQYSRAIAISACATRQEESAGDSNHSLVLVSFYKFADFPDHADMRSPLRELCEELRVSGGIILAPEGINGSICGMTKSVEKVLLFIEADDRLKGLRLTESPVSPEEEAIHHGHTSESPLGAGEDAPFRWDHVRVKLKKEVVSLGVPGISPAKTVGKYVNPKEWNSLISDPDT
ncbi:hypothetical protein KI387_036754, partial [Taxus chinensis]